MKIEIKCTGATTAELDNILDFQGDLKTLSEENYQKFKTDLITLGFSEPISVWNSNGKLYCLNGHQRCKTLKRLREEGYDIPLLPINLIEADDITQAKKKVLALTSQFGEITQDGLIDFCEKNMLNIDDMMKEFRFPEIIDIEKDIDYSILNDEGIENELEELKSGLKKAIQIEFNLCDYDECFELVKFFRKETGDVGKIVLECLRKKKEEIK